MTQCFICDIEASRDIAVDPSTILAEFRKHLAMQKIGFEGCEVFAQIDILDDANSHLFTADATATLIDHHGRYNI